MPEFLLFASFPSMDSFVLRVCPVPITSRLLLVAECTSHPPLEQPAALVDPHMGPVRTLPAPIGRPQNGGKQQGSPAAHYPLFLGLFPRQWGPPVAPGGALSGMVQCSRAPIGCVRHVQSRVLTAQVPFPPLLLKGAGTLLRGTRLPFPISSFFFIPILHTHSPSVH